MIAVAGAVRFGALVQDGQTLCPRDHIDTTSPVSYIRHWAERVT